MDHLAECDQFTISMRSQNNLHSQWSELSTSTKMRNQGNHFISNANIERVGRNSMLKNVLISSKSDFIDIVQNIPGSNVRVQNEKISNFKDVKEAVFGINGMGMFDRVCFSGNDTWVNQVMKGVNSEDVDVKVL